MSKSIYEEALELLNNGCDGPDAFDDYKIALEQAQKQEKLLELYRELMTAKDELLSIGWFGDEYYETVKKEIGLEKQIKELEDESK